MSKIAEQKALEEYPIVPDNNALITQETFNVSRRVGYIKGYDQAMQDMARDAEKLQYLSDEFGYAYACGCEKTMQDFMEKAESFLENKVSDYFWWNNDECFVEFDKEECIKEFKRYVQDEIQN